jgi:small redox-active disulfide protein 2
MLIKILGPGCANCHTLERLTREALAELHLAAEVSSVTDYATIAGYGVMTTPALVVDDRVVLAGRIPTAAQLRGLLTTAAA